MAKIRGIILISICEIKGSRTSSPKKFGAAATDLDMHDLRLGGERIGRRVRGARAKFPDPGEGMAERQGQISLSAPGVPRSPSPYVTPTAVLHQFAPSSLSAAS